jgi:non-ribosomal peptide synthetase component E (peptide arylation enzyme)
LVSQHLRVLRAARIVTTQREAREIEYTLTDAHIAHVVLEPAVTAQQVFGMAEGLVCVTRLDDPPETIATTQGRPLSPADELRIVGAAGRCRPGRASA